MADVFLSYAHENQEQARELANVLGNFGWSVFWDREILAGTVFDDAIQEQLDHAKCVVALWSERSVTSQWVRAEAEEGANRNMLVSVLIDDVRLPIAFRRIQAAKLLNWSGSADDEQMGDIIRAIKFVVEKPPLKTAVEGDAVEVACATSPAAPRPVTANFGIAVGTYGAAATPAPSAPSASTPKPMSRFLVPGIIAGVLIAAVAGWLATHVPAAPATDVPGAPALHVPAAPAGTLSEGELVAHTKNYAELIGENKPDEVRTHFTADLARTSKALTAWSSKKRVEERGAFVQVGEPSPLKVTDSERRNIEVPITYRNQTLLFTFTYTPMGEIAELNWKEVKKKAGH